MMSDDFEISLRRGHEPAEGIVAAAAPQDDGAILYRGQRIPLSSAGLTIGRDPGCDLVLASGLVAPRHARIASRRRQVRAPDLDSRTGTYLNGERFVGADARAQRG